MGKDRGMHVGAIQAGNAMMSMDQPKKKRGFWGWVKDVGSGIGKVIGGIGSRVLNDVTGGVSDVIVNAVTNPIDNYIRTRTGQV